MALQDLVNQQANTINSTRQQIDNNEINASAYASNTIDTATKSIVDISNTLFQTFVNEETTKNINAFSQIDEENMRNGVYYHIDNDLQKGLVSTEEEARNNRELARKNFEDNISNAVYRQYFKKASDNYVTQTQSTFNTNTANFLMTQWSKKLETITSGYLTSEYTVDDINLLRTATGYGYEGLQAAFDDLVMNGWLSEEEIKTLTSPRSEDNSNYLATLAMLDVKLQFKGGKDSDIKYSSFNNIVDQESFKKGVQINYASTLASQEVNIDWLTFDASTYAENKKQEVLKELEEERGNSPNYTLKLDDNKTTVVLTDEEAQQYAESVANKSAEKANIKLQEQQQALRDFETKGQTVQTIINDPMYVSDDTELAQLLSDKGYTGDINYYLSKYGSTLRPIMAENADIKNFAKDFQNMFDETVSHEERVKAFNNIAKSKYASTFSAYGFDFDTWSNIEGNLHADQINYFKSVVGDKPDRSNYQTEEEYNKALNYYNNKAENVFTDITKNNNQLTRYSWTQQQADKEKTISEDVTRYIIDNPNLGNRMFDEGVDSYDAGVRFFIEEGFSEEQAKALASEDVTANVIALQKEKKEFDNNYSSFEAILSKNSDEKTFNDMKNTEIGKSLGLNQYESYSSFEENYSVPDVIKNAIQGGTSLSDAFVDFRRGYDTTNIDTINKANQKLEEQKKVAEQNINREAFYQDNSVAIGNDILNNEYSNVEDLKEYLLAKYPQIGDSDKYGEDYLDTIALQFENQIKSVQATNTIVDDLVKVFNSSSTDNGFKESLEYLQNNGMLGITGIVDINNITDESFKSSDEYEFYQNVVSSIRRANPELTEEEVSKKAVGQLIKDYESNKLKDLFLTERTSTDMFNASNVMDKFVSAIESTNVITEILTTCTEGLSELEKGRAMTTLTTLLSDFGTPSYIKGLKTEELVKLYQAEYVINNDSMFNTTDINDAKSLIKRYTADYKYKIDAFDYNFGYLLANGKTTQAETYYTLELNSQLAYIDENNVSVDTVNRILNYFGIKLTDEEVDMLNSDINDMTPENRVVSIDYYLQQTLPSKIEENFEYNKSLCKNKYRAYDKEYGSLTDIANVSTMQEYIKEQVENETIDTEVQRWNSLIDSGTFKNGITKDLSYGTSTIPLEVYNAHDVDGSYTNAVKEVMYTFTSETDRNDYLLSQKAHLTEEAYKELSNMPSVNIIVGQKEKLKDINLLDYAKTQLLSISSEQNYGLGMTNDSASDYVTRVLNSNISEIQALADKTDDDKYTKANFLNDVTNLIRTDYIMQSSPQENVANPQFYVGFTSDNCNYGEYLTKTNKSKNLVSIPVKKKQMVSDFNKMGEDVSISSKYTYEYLNTSNANTGDNQELRAKYMNMFNEPLLKDVGLETDCAQQAIIMNNVLLANGFNAVSFDYEDLKTDAKKVWDNVFNTFRKVALEEGNSGELLFAFLKMNNEQNIKNKVRENLSRSVGETIVTPEVEILPNGNINIITSVIDSEGNEIEKSFPASYTDGKLSLKINGTYADVEQFSTSLSNKQIAKYIFDSEYSSAYTGLLSDDVFLFDYKSDTVNKVQNYNNTTRQYLLSNPSEEDYVCILTYNNTNPAFQDKDYYEFDKVSGKTLVEKYKNALENNSISAKLILDSLPNDWKNWLIAQ